MLDSKISKQALESLRESVVIVDAQAPDHPILYVNRAFERITGYRADEVVGRNCRFLQGPRTDPAVVAQIREAVDAAAGCDVRLLNYRKDGTAFHNELRIAPIFDDQGDLTYFIALQRDVTREVIAENLARSYSDELESLNAELHQLALRDPLTDLHNRRYFDTRLEVMSRAAADSRRPLSVFLIDVDHFKRLNDHYGHQVGDDCLARLGRALRQVARAEDLVARYGGEEFVIAALGDDRRNARFASRLLWKVRALNMPHEPSPVADCVTISIGYAAETPNESCDADAIVESADRALYRAKQLGRNRAVEAEAAAPAAAAYSSTTSAS